VIDHGKLLYDGGLDALAAKMAPQKLIRVELSTPLNGHHLDQYGEVIHSRGQKAELLVPRENTSDIAARMLSELPIADVTIEDPPIEDVITRVFEQAAQARRELGIEDEEDED
jgi:ABC-2 type transport system ATP-binding protein